jgi:hypothetical protein
MTQGTPVKILVKAGCVERGTAGRATKFCGTVEPGQNGLYLYPCPGTLKREDWHVIAFGAWDVPLHRSQFEVLP